MAALVGLIAGAGLLGFVLSSSQRPPAPPLSPTPPVVTVTATPVPQTPVTGFGYSVVDDPTSHQLVLFGGVDNYDATWLWNGQSWQLADPAASPSGRFGSAAAYDPESGRVMLFGGRLAGGELVNDTWAWNGANWVELDSGAGGPPPGEDASMAWDAALREMLLVTRADSGAETWVWAGRWMREPRGDLATGFLGGMAVDPVSGDLLLVAPPPGPTGGSGSTWQWVGDSWQKTAAGTPFDIAGPALDPGGGHLLLCGSTSTTGSEPTAWSWSGAAWGALPNSSPPARDDLGVATDLETGRLLLFGSLNPPTELNPQPLHVWWWAGDGWQALD